MTELLYQTDSYLQTFDAVVTGIRPDSRGVILDRTAFYPGGGGQPNDVGELRAGERVFPVAKVLKDGRGRFAPSRRRCAAARARRPVTGQLDWERRYQLMRTHTALHILCGVIFRDYGAQVTGGNMDPLQGPHGFRVRDACQGDLVREIEAAVNREVASRARCAGRRSCRATRRSRFPT